MSSCKGETVMRGTNTNTQIIRTRACSCLGGGGGGSGAQGVPRAHERSRWPTAFLGPGLDLFVPITWRVCTVATTGTLVWCLFPLNCSMSCGDWSVVAVPPAHAAWSLSNLGVGVCSITKDGPQLCEPAVTINTGTPTPRRAMTTVHGRAHVCVC